MDAFARALGLLPAGLREACAACPPDRTEELRLRLGRRISAVTAGRETELKGDALTERELMQVLERATGASLHSAIGSIQNGFISCAGLRIGICGEAVVTSGKISGFRRYSSLNIRIPHERRGAGREVIGEIFAGGPRSALIISAPGFGKTTLLREMIRTLADGGARVGVADERNELAAAYAEGEGYSLGRCSDVITLAPKNEAAMLLLRAMSPELIAMDEISRAEDARTVEEICGCGVKILATAHALDLNDMRRRPMYRALLEEGIFERIVTIRLRDGRRIYTQEAVEK